jgi:hypothetical protein
MADLDASGLTAIQPRRLGTAINMFGPTWRSENALFSLARQENGTLALLSVDPTSGATRDLGLRLPAGTGQGAGLGVRWDARHGQALLLARPSNGASSLQAWLVSFVSSSAEAGASR